MQAALLGLLALAYASLGREALERSCEECHAKTAAEWRESFHRKAYTNAAYEKQSRGPFAVVVMLQRLTRKHLQPAGKLKAVWLA